MFKGRARRKDNGQKKLQVVVENKTTATIKDIFIIRICRFH